MSPPESLYRIFKLAVSLLALFLWQPSIYTYATPSASPQFSDLYINSDLLTFDQRKNTAHFTGQVVICFQDMLVRTSKLQINYKKNNNRLSVDKIIIPASLAALRKKSQEVLVADYAEYSMATAELTLKGKIVLLHEDNILRTEKLVYYTRLQSVNNRLRINQE